MVSCIHHKTQSFLLQAPMLCLHTHTHTRTCAYTLAPADTICEGVSALSFRNTSILSSYSVLFFYLITVFINCNIPHDHLHEIVHACLPASVLPFNDSATGRSACVTFDTLTWISETP